MGAMIEVHGVSKRYGGQLAVSQLDLEVPRGICFGLLGHNGSGKSSLIGMLLGQIFPDTGRLAIGGFDVFAARARALRRVGAIFEAPAFHEYLSGARNLRLLADYSGGVDATRFKEVVRLVGLQQRIDDPVAAYSHGMRQRLALAQALLPEPELLLLDEPHDGLDPEGIHDLRETLAFLHRERGMTIVFSSHELAEVQRLCSHVAILRRGELLFAGDWRAELAARPLPPTNAAPRPDPALEDFYLALSRRSGSE
jgi:ABC-2 type transport system ATP-binding protein